MHGDIDILMLACAALAALAFGVLTGYACCKATFSVLRLKTHPKKAEPARVRSTLAS